MYKSKSFILLVLTTLTISIWWVILQILPAKDTIYNYLYNGAVSFIYFFGGILTLYYAKKTSKNNALRNVFIYFSLALISWGIAGFIWTFYNIYLHVESPYPSLADPFYLACGLFSAISLWYVFDFFHFTPKREHIYLSLIIVTIMYWLVFFILRKPGYNDQLPFLAVIYNYLYPLTDAFLLSIGTIILITIGKLGFGIGSITIYILLQSIADIIFSWRQSKGVYWNGDISDIFYSLSGIFLILGMIKMYHRFKDEPDKRNILTERITHQTKDNQILRNEIKRDLYTTIIVLMFLLTINFVIWQFLKNDLCTKTKSDIRVISFNLVKNIESKFDNYTGLLEMGANYFTSSQSVERHEFINFYNNPLQNYINTNKDIAMFSFIEKVTNKADFEKKIKSEQTVPSYEYYYFSIYPDSTSTDRYVVNYIYPWAANKRYFGYDVMTDSVFSSYFTEAIERGKFVTTDPGLFINRNLLLFIRPVYLNGGQTETIGEKKAAISGFIVMFLDPEKMFDSVINHKEYENIDIFIYNGNYSTHELDGYEPVFLQKNISTGNKDLMSELHHIRVGSKIYTVLVRADISSKQNFFGRYFPDINLLISNLLAIGFIILLTQLKSQNHKLQQYMVANKEK
ncbi:MAG: CHASE domain-containing protein [Patescibacteria group bacterium]